MLSDDVKAEGTHETQATVTFICKRLWSGWVSFFFRTGAQGSRPLPICLDLYFNCDKKHCKCLPLLSLSLSLG